MVAQQIDQPGIPDAAGGVNQVIEPLKALRLLRNLILRQQGIKLERDLLGVDHHVFGRTGMDGPPPEFEGRRRRVEVLELDLPGGAAVEGIGVIGAEIRNVEMERPLADLLVRRKADAELSVREISGGNPFDSGQNLRDAGLVVGAEKRGAVRSWSSTGAASFRSVTAAARLIRPFFRN